MAGIVVGDAHSAAHTKFGPSTSDRGRGNPSTSDSVDQGLSDFSAPLNDQLRAIRRKLWILNAKLQSLPAKIEMIYRQSGRVRSRVDDARPIDACTTELDSLKKDSRSMARRFSVAGRPDGTAPDSGHGRIEPNVTQSLR